MSDWFLPSTERPWSSGNLVTPRVHGAEYFPRLVEAVSRARDGDEVFFTDWRGDGDELLAEGGPTVAELFCGAARRGVRVRALLWRSHSDWTSFSAQENQHLGVQLNDAGGEALLDERVRRGGSHHQKLVVVRYARESERDVAFVGGIDLCHSRRDDGSHAGDPQRQSMDERYGARPPWHDAMLEVTGPAVADVQAAFVERWNDPTPVDHRNPYRRLRQRAAHMPRRAAPITDVPAPPPAAGSHAVQVLRTYPAKRPAFPFAPKGERTVARAYERVFARATKLVYIEDQYLWSTSVAGALARALRSTPSLHVIAVVPRFPDADGRLSGPPNRLGQLAAMRMLSEAGEDRFGVYDIENDAGTPIYVHAKVCIVDDAWMSCGSDNFNRRSWTHDSELTCGVVDPDGELPRQFRTKLWAEHLGVDESDPRLGDVDDAVDLWQGLAGSAGCRVRVHRPVPVSRADRLWSHPLQRLVFDPDGRPISLRMRRRF